MRRREFLGVLGSTAAAWPLRWMPWFSSFYRRILFLRRRAKVTPGSVFPGWRTRLQTAFLLQPFLYLGDALLAGVKRSRTRVHRVVSEGEIMRMACG
jgi:hypothetical protein